ncbi:hypothetical protein CP969_17430 [Streptomyces viridosporus T7A]|uniref:Uncharacterized protein n=2 Tax=Streptomyces viridosporus TaxID=67581 RepID=A0ABX6AEN6_STRVD|nr:hypothetical protein CP969_17430 [Streptomyces viridosporus T7A]
MHKRPRPAGRLRPMKQPDRLPLTPHPLPPLRGDESIVGVPDTTVVDFRRFALPDLRMNNTCGPFAEFPVHRAVGSHEPRVEFAPRRPVRHPCPTT